MKKKIHSLIDTIYRRKNLEMAWEMVKANRGRGGVDGQSLAGFAAQLDRQLDRLLRELKEGVCQPGRPGPGGDFAVACQSLLHHVLDLWVKAWRKKVARGDEIVVHYADGAVPGFQYREEAEKFLEDLRPPEGPGATKCASFRTN